MSNSWKIERMKYCRIEKNGGKTQYYVMVGGQPVEVEKEVYYVIERSYHKEWLFKHGKNSKYVSLEKLAEDEEGNILHDRVPVALRLPSAEEEYLLSEERDDEDEKIDAMNAEINMLSEEKKQLMLSYVEENGAVGALADREKVTRTAIYYRRSRLAKSLAKKLSAGEANE